jgi:hypothetical protein
MGEGTDDCKRNILTMVSVTGEASWSKVRRREEGGEY